MINLETGPVQFFANCIHLDVNGPGTNLPADDQLVAFPGVYEKVRISGVDAQDFSLLRQL